MTGGTVVVVPCYNEARRLDIEALLTLTNEPSLRILLVDDGSTDETGALLASAAERSPAVSVLRLARNAGKAEALRQGLTQALAGGADFVGFLDADLSTPPSEFLRLHAVLTGNEELDVVMGCRIVRLGTRISRTGKRHVVGRVYATGAALALGVAVYDTQCGAKIFRATPALSAGLRPRFGASWGFDVQLLHRMLRGAASAPPLVPERIMEVPLEEWTDVPGSRVRPWGALRAGLELVPIAWSRWRSGR